MSTPLCEVADLENVIRTPIPPDGLEAADAAILAASDAIRWYCRQTLTRVTDDHILLSGGCGLLYLPELPIVAISALSVGGVAQPATTYTWEPSGLLVRLTLPSGGVPASPTWWDSGYKNVSVTYSHGYLTPPADLTNVCARMAARQYLGGLRSAVVGPHAREADYSSVYQNEPTMDVAGAYGPTSSPILTGDEKRALAAYRIAVFA